MRNTVPYYMQAAVSTEPAIRMTPQTKLSKPCVSPTAEGTYTNFHSTLLDTGIWTAALFFASRIAVQQQGVQQPPCWNRL